MNPLFEKIDSYSTIIAGDKTDAYLPQLNEEEFAHIKFPVILFLQGFDVDKSCYSQFTRKLASYGFLVLVPNHRPSGRPFLAPELQQIQAVLASLVAERKSAWAEKFDHQQVILLGHSCGGLTGLQALQEVSPNSHDISFPQLVGGVFYGSQLTGVQMKKKTGMPIALIAGNLDGIVSPDWTKKTYQHIQSVPKAYMTINGANHYGITDTAQPLGGPEEENSPLLEQHISIHRIAHWSATFLRAYVLNDQESRECFSCDDCKLDEYTSLLMVQDM